MATGLRVKTMLDELTKGILSKSVSDTKALAVRLAEFMGFKGVIALSGTLGAGKTVFAKGLGEALGVKTNVKSPSFNVCLSYAGKKSSFVHIDAYRLKGPADYDLLLIDEFVAEPKLICVEWPEIVADALPADTLWLAIELDGDNKTRRIRKVSSKYKSPHSLV